MAALNLQQKRIEMKMQVINNLIKNRKAEIIIVTKNNIKGCFCI